ncbi:MAG TPA: GNAT family N-acetyltransferase [Rhizomicrobium sp.]|nr:GNAT family N-acetyltransferase [Rhizomicrobium sp.]
MKNGPITGQVISPALLSTSDQQTWRQLLAPRPAAFLSFAYARAVASCVPLVRICRIEQGGRTVAFFPFQYRSRAHAAAGIGERLGGELSDYFGLVAAPDFHIEAQTLLRLSGLRSLFFTHLEQDDYGHRLSGCKPEVGHRIDFPQGGGAFWEEKGRTDKKFVSDTERRERKLIREYGPLSFVYSSVDAVKSLDTLISQKRAQYRRTQVGDALGAEKTRALLVTLCRTNDPQCSGIVSTLHAGETWVASHFGLRSGSTLHYWFPVYNPALKAFAPGRLLLKQIIQSSPLHGLARIDRGAGDSVAKRDFSTSQHFFSTGLWQRPGIGALTHRVWLAIDWRMTRYFGRRVADME